jgi:hypothetical protein
VNPSTSALSRPNLGIEYKSLSVLDAGNIIYLLIHRSGLRLDYALIRSLLQRLNVVVGLY